MDKVKRETDIETRINFDYPNMFSFGYTGKICQPHEPSFS